jgi:hypothetical protein
MGKGFAATAGFAAAAGFATADAAPGAVGLVFTYEAWFEPSASTPGS